MKVYEGEHDNIVEDLIMSLEQETEQKVFTLKVVDQIEEGLEVLVVFEDKSILHGMIKVQSIEGKLACRIQGNYI